jgi:hypothetical protein
MATVTRSLQVRRGEDEPSEILPLLPGQHLFHGCPGGIST